MAQEQGADLHTVLRGSLVQGGELPEVHGVHAGTMLAQQRKPYVSKKSSSTTKRLHVLISLRKLVPIFHI